MSSMFHGIDDPSIPIGDDRRYFDSGRYALQVEAHKSITKEQSKKGRASFIAEMIVLQSDAPKLGVGAMAAWVLPFETDPTKGGLTKAFARLKAYLAALLNVDDPAAALAASSPPYTIESFCKVITCDANPLRGSKIDLVATERPFTRKDGTSGIITVHQWCPAGTVFK